MVSQPWVEGKPWRSSMHLLELQSTSICSITPHRVGYVDILKYNRQQSLIMVASFEGTYQANTANEVLFVTMNPVTYAYLTSVSMNVGGNLPQFDTESLTSVTEDNAWYFTARYNSDYYIFKVKCDNDGSNITIPLGKKVTATVNNVADQNQRGFPYMRYQWGDEIMIMGQFAHATLTRELVVASLDSTLTPQWYVSLAGSSSGQMGFDFDHVSGYLYVTNMNSASAFVIYQIHSQTRLLGWSKQYTFTNGEGSYTGHDLRFLPRTGLLYVANSAGSGQVPHVTMINAYDGSIYKNFVFGDTSINNFLIGQQFDNFTNAYIGLFDFGASNVRELKINVGMQNVAMANCLNLTTNITVTPSAINSTLNLTYSTYTKAGSASLFTDFNATITAPTGQTNVTYIPPVPASNCVIGNYIAATNLPDYIGLTGLGGTIPYTPFTTVGGGVISYTLEFYSTKDGSMVTQSDLSFTQSLDGGNIKWGNFPGGAYVGRLIGTASTNSSLKAISPFVIKVQCPENCLVCGADFKCNLCLKTFIVDIGSGECKSMGVPLSRIQTSETIAQSNSIATTTAIASVGATSAMNFKLDPSFWYMANSIQIARTVTLLNVPLPITLEKYFNEELDFVSFNIPYLDVINNAMFDVNMKKIDVPSLDTGLQFSLEKYKLSSPFFIGQFIENFYTYLSAHTVTIFWLVILQLVQLCCWKVPKAKGKLGDWKQSWLNGLFFNITLRVYLEHCLDLLLLAFVGVVSIHAYKDQVAIQAISVTFAFLYLLTPFLIFGCISCHFCRRKREDWSDKVEETFADSNDKKRSAIIILGFFIFKRVAIALSCSLFGLIHPIAQITLSFLPQLAHWLSLIIFRPFAERLQLFTAIVYEGQVVLLFLSCYLYVGLSDYPAASLIIGDIVVMIFSLTQIVMGAIITIIQIVILIWSIKERCQKKGKVDDADKVEKMSEKDYQEVKESPHSNIKEFNQQNEDVKTRAHTVQQPEEKKLDAESGASLEGTIVASARKDNYQQDDLLMEDINGQQENYDFE